MRVRSLIRGIGADRCPRPHSLNHITRGVNMLLSTGLLTPEDEMLTAYRIISTRDLDDARMKVAEVFCSHKLVANQQQSRLNLRHNRVTYEDVALNYMDYGCEVQITPGELNSFFLVQVPVRGGSVITSAGETVESNSSVATVVNPTDHLSMTWLDDSPHFVVYLSRTSVEEKMTELTGKVPATPIRFDVPMHLKRDSVRGWCELVEILRKDADADNVTLHPTVRRQIEDTIIIGLLSVQSHNFSGSMFGHATPPCPRTIQRAIQLCEQSPEGIANVSEMAAHVGISIRSLQAGFKRYVGMTPMQYLRDVRLRRVREEIQAQTAPDRSISEIAYSWGFTHLGRFAAEYRRRFDESPSQSKRAIF